MRRALSIAAVFVGVAIAIACSKSDDSSSSSSGSGACRCDITNNGNQRDVPCGQQACLGGTMFNCTPAGHVEPGADCPGGPGTSSGSSGTSSGALDLECTLGARGADSLKTTYSCPSQDAFTQCRNGNATGCKPKDKKAGTVPLGGACKKAFVASDPGGDFELGDDCAPVVKYGGDGAPKGAFCAFGYCTHLCAPTSVCSDVAPGAQCGGTAVCEK